jgi:ParB-like chromosome segregation protein Spo0J
MTLIPTDLIDTRVDARALDQATVAGLAESIASVGLINPVRVRSDGDRWEVIAGAHRLMAYRQLGLAEIECAIVSDDDLHAELAMIDENLCRAELSPADRAKQTARRKAIYLELHPETAHGGDRKSDQVANNATRFSADTATKTGQSERAVQLNAERGEKVIAEVIDLIRGTKLDTGTYLDKLKRMTPNDQFKAASRDLAHLRAQERERASGGGIRFKPKAAPIGEDEAKENQVRALMAAWNKAGKDAREEFLARIDTPVFDRSVA